MFVDSATIKRGSKSYSRHLLRSSYRENGKVKHKTIANLSACSDGEINAIKLALKHKKDLSALDSIKNVKSVLGKRVGAIWSLFIIAERIGIKKALNSTINGKLALLQVIARIIDQGSRLSAVRLAQKNAICEIIGIENLTEDDLYKNLDWLADQQEKIEKIVWNAIPEYCSYVVFVRCNEFISGRHLQ